MTDPDVVLLQFPYSHYNEKGRWALDYKRVRHRRVDYLPGPHIPQIKRLTGQTQTPVLRLGDELIHGSARIIDEIERRYPEPALYPEDPPLRSRALEIARYFDDEVGPMVRRVLFSVLLDEPNYLCWMFSSKRSLPVRFLYRASFPLARGMMGKSMGITDRASIEEAFAATRVGLGFVSDHVRPTGYLVGDSFSVADLTAAALLAPLVQLSHPDMSRPTPMPAAVEKFVDRWSAHPATEWVREQYRRHRTTR
jgi:glutathione S-transferase